MRFEIIEVETGFKTVNTTKLIINCQGSGTLDDPLILDSSIELPKWFYIYDSKLYLKIIECNDNSIGLFNCQNIYVKNSSLNSLYLSNCSNNIIEHCQRIKKLGLSLSNDNKIKLSSINKLKISRSNGNFIQECTIEKIKYRNNTENTFFNNEIPDEELLKTKKQPTFVSLNLIKIINFSMIIAFYTTVLILIFILPYIFWFGVFMLILVTFILFILPKLLKKIIEKKREAKTKLSTN